MPKSCAFLKQLLVKDAEDFVVVEVLGDDGAFQCGKAVARSTSRVLVDFRCAGRRLEWVPLDQVFLSRVDFYTSKAPLTTFYGNQGCNDPVEVPMQHSPTEPWKWYPATALVYDWCYRQFGWVTIHYLSGDVNTVVPYDRIRLHAPRVSLADGAQEKLERGQLEEMLQFYSKSVLRLLEDENSSTTPINSRKRRRGHEFLTRPKRWKGELCCSGSSASPVQKKPSALDVYDALQCLPAKILTETFQYLCTVAQGRLRAVCAAWNDLLTSAAVKSLLHIRFPSESNSNRPRSSSPDNVYIPVAGLHHCWSNRSVAIVGSPVADIRQATRLKCLPWCDGLFLRQIMQGGAEKFPSHLIVKDISCVHYLDTFEDYITTIHTVFDSLARICRTLTVKNRKEP
ncbi:uncharacterized protein LOC129597550 [Paramacrobiotus metropolitanus]|uniref:uncharacterized protein LOC129597550 n=1 Tax=Paramacrobiotus metropolitanus TaxID=2943436 RepID=UPI002446149A|nr:uncharacterized protein LOC129597550 [Paramacrobiotus metropolitanus]